MNQLLQKFHKLNECKLPNWTNDEYNYELNLFIEKYTDELIILIDRNFNEHSEIDNKKDLEFSQKNIDHWKNIFNVFEILISCSLDMIISWKDRHLDLEEKFLSDCMIRLHAKSILISKEILCLCKNGFADGALARWRSLHEISCIILFIGEYGEECAEQFIHHSIIDESKWLNEYEKTKDRLNIKFEYDADFFQVGETLLKERYGNEFCKDYGWASKYINTNNRIGLATIEKSVALDHYRFFYKQASQAIHISHLHLINNLAQKQCENDILLVGRSNSGMTLPINLAALSLLQTTLKILANEPHLEDTIASKALAHYLDVLENKISSMN